MPELEGEYEPSQWGWVRDQIDAFEATDGREAGTLMDTGIPVIVVTMRGAKSGKVRKIALMRVEHDGEYALVASKGGAPEHPGWYLNLKANPDEVLIQDGAEKLAYTVRELEGDERQTWWDRSAAVYADYLEYQKNTDRLIPVLLATPKA
jgi:deazaflavin-dependent oxidoreductase (nitroreductase family)